MGFNNKYEYGYYDEINLVTGPRDDIIRIAKTTFLTDGTADEAIENLKDGKYVSLDIGECWAFPSSLVMKEFPSCELFIYSGEYFHYTISDAGQATVEEGNICSNSASDVVKSLLPDQIKRVIEGQVLSTSISIRLIDGRELQYVPSSKSIKMIDSLISQPLTFELLSDVCNPYTKPHKRKEFVETMRSSIDRIDSILSLTFTSSIESQFDENDIDKLRNTELAEKLSDITILRYLNSSLIESEQKIFDYSKKTLTTKKESIVSAMRDPLAGEYDFVKIEYKKPFEKEEPIVGLSPSDTVDKGPKRDCFRKCISVKFSDDKVYKYNCAILVNVGDKVKVSGAKKGQIGTVEKIVGKWTDNPYMQEVVELIEE